MHKCNSDYCSKCHKDRIFEARAAGYKDGLLTGLEWAFALRPEGVPGGWLAKAIKEVGRTGKLPEEAS